MPAREKTSVTFLAAAVVGRGAVEILGEAEFGGFAVGCSAGSRYKPVRGELMRRSSRLVNHTAYPAQTTSPLPGTGARLKSAAICPNATNRKNPGVRHTARQSRDREGALANSGADMRSRPRGHPVAARIGASRPSTFMARTPRVS